MALLQLGYIRLALLDAQGNKLKTLILPPPEVGSPEMDWEPKENTWDLDDGELTRTLGYLPVLTCKWSAYDERPLGPYAVGTGDGQRPCLEDLLVILSLPTGRLRVSPGMSAGGFTVNRVLLKPIGRRGPVYTGLQATFRARKVRDARDLEVF